LFLVSFSFGFCLIFVIWHTNYCTKLLIKTKISIVKTNSFSIIPISIVPLFDVWGYFKMVSVTLDKCYIFRRKKLFELKTFWWFSLLSDLKKSNSFDNKFNWTISYRSDSDFSTPYDGGCRYQKIEKQNDSILDEWMKNKTGG
jgi:hypothetical protein